MTTETTTAPVAVPAVSVMVKDTHTLCVTSPKEIAHLNVPGSRLLLTKGTETMTVTVKADRNGGTSAFMIYLAEAHAYSKFVGGASRSNLIAITVAKAQ
jgi:hypothetical protein